MKQNFISILKYENTQSMRYIEKEITLMELTQCINYLLTIAQHSVFQFLSNQLSEYDITPSQYGVLSCLWTKEYATPKQISEILCLETSTISGVLDRMQKKGLIERFVNKEDRREVRIVATEKGIALQQPVQDIIERVNEVVLSNFSEYDIAVLKQNLKSIASTKYMM